MKTYFSGEKYVIMSDVKESFFEPVLWTELIERADSRILFILIAVIFVQYIKKKFIVQYFNIKLYHIAFLFHHEKKN